MGEKILTCILDTLNNMSPSEYGKLLEEAEDNFDPFFESVDHPDYLNENSGDDMVWVHYDWEPNCPVINPNEHMISTSAEEYSFAMAA